MTSKLSAFARVGVARAELDVSSSATVTDVDTGETTTTASDFTNSDTGIALGVGLTYDITDRLYIRGDYSRYDLENAELDSVGLGIGVRF
nr:outer membrane beta-barrel protein [Hyphomonas sp. Mor2]